MKRSKNVRRITMDGVTATMHEHAERLGISYGKLYNGLSKAGIKLVRDCHIAPIDLLPSNTPYIPTGPRRVRPKRPVPICQTCGIEFARSGRNHYCSTFCNPKNRSKIRIKKVQPVKLPKKEVECLVCGTQFRQKNFRQKFCTEKCQKRDESIRSKNLPRNKAKSTWNPMSHEEVMCRCCAKPLPIPHHFMAVLCSKKCRRRWKHRKQTLRRQTIPAERMRDKLRNRLRECLQKRGRQKTNSILTYLGCTPKELAEHMENQFHSGMTWENYGVFGWHIDHIIPCASFDLTREDHIHVCFHYSNLQPLWHMENSLKQDNHTLHIPDTLKRKAFAVGILVL